MYANKKSECLKNEMPIIAISKDLKLKRKRHSYKLAIEMGNINELFF